MEICFTWNHKYKRTARGNPIIQNGKYRSSVCCIQDGTVSPPPPPGLHGLVKGWHLQGPVGDELGGAEDGGEGKPVLQPLVAFRHWLRPVLRVGWVCQKDCDHLFHNFCHHHHHFWLLTRTKLSSLQLSYMILFQVWNLQMTFLLRWQTFYLNPREGKSDTLMKSFILIVGEQKIYPVHSDQFWLIQEYFRWRRTWKSTRTSKPRRANCHMPLSTRWNKTTHFDWCQ